MVFLERTIYQGLQWVVFQPEDEPTWATAQNDMNNGIIICLVGVTPDRPSEFAIIKN